MTEADICKRQKLITFVSVCDIISLLPTGAPLLSQIDFWPIIFPPLKFLSSHYFCPSSFSDSGRSILTKLSSSVREECTFLSSGIDEDKVLSENIYYRVGDTDWDNHN